MTKGERDWLKLQDSFICLSLYLKICTVVCSSFSGLIDVSWIWDGLYHVRDETYLCFIYVSLETWSLFIYQWFLDLRKCVMSATCDIHVLYLFSYGPYMLEWKCLMWCFYIYSCVIYLVTYITVLFCHTHLHPTDAMI